MEAMIFIDSFNSNPCNWEMGYCFKITITISSSKVDEFYTDSRQAVLTIRELAKKRDSTEISESSTCFLRNKTYPTQSRVIAGLEINNGTIEEIEIISIDEILEKIGKFF